ncbi:MAG: riboflavin synthase [Proteobacteria bacterium]|nr:riboflavin synthase [Pseudomonadota bacterium]
MFTGLIQEVGTLISLARHGMEAEIKISSPLENFEIGESIAIMGACLSVTNFGPGYFTAFTSYETLEKTGLKDLGSGARVNIERALKTGDAMGGHIVTGHVDARVKIISRTKLGKAERFSIALPDPPIDRQIASKGSVAIDGISLTVNEVHPDSFDVMIIPLSLSHTTLGDAKPGDIVNIETDVLAKYVARQLERDTNASQDINIELLTKAGFMR